ncbi:hypothetical protein F4781DRAFT_413013 [Annulohypoxylon bovei var. microspora]|nr:hypothetical protein F4781DRAFT_413013 [Annulohypoxylon bovei var. microspora]
MSLGINSLWRARILKVHIGGFSPIPREQYNPLFLQRSSPRQWYSTPIVREVVVNEPSKHLSQSSFDNKLRRRLIRRRSNSELVEPALVKFPVQYRTGRLSRKSLRQYQRGVANQILFDAAREISGKPLSTWRTTLAFMLLVTPSHGEVLNFRVIIGKGVSAEARQILSGPDTHISEICRRNECFVQIENSVTKDEQLIFTLSGSEISVRNSLRDIIGVVGAITAVRISDPASQRLLLDVWKEAVERRPETRLLRSGEAGETVVDDKTITVKASLSNTHTIYKPYRLIQRADDIGRPISWTKTSFEEYVAALVHGEVPTSLARSLYPNYPDHQQTVVSMLVNLFTSRNTRHAISLSATKMALRFIGSCGHGFRRESWTIYTRVRQLHMPLDAEIFNIFLVNASKDKDINTFNRILRLMVRRGFPPQSRAWVAFLVMIQRPAAKRYIVAKLMAKNLDHNPMILRAIGREMAMVNLESRLSAAPSATLDIEKFVDKMNDAFGSGWLDVVTLNKILDLLSMRNRLDACKVLLSVVHSTQCTLPDAVTLNTMLSRVNGFAKQMEMLQSILTRWPRLIPDAVTYHLLFRMGWTRRYPNMLRVVWRYAVLSDKTSSRMRHTLSKLIRQTENPSNRTAFLKGWEGVIFGQKELAETRLTQPDILEVRYMMPKYVTHARGMRPAVNFGDKLKEAISMDVKIHQALKEGKMAEIKSHTVDIPLEPKVRREASEFQAPGEEPGHSALGGKDWYDEQLDMLQSHSQPGTKTRKEDRWVQTALVEDGNYEN